jgi:hypothetical protein
MEGSGTEHPRPTLGKPGDVRAYNLDKPSTSRISSVRCRVDRRGRTGLSASACVRADANDSWRLAALVDSSAVKKRVNNCIEWSCPDLSETFAAVMQLRRTSSGFAIFPLTKNRKLLRDPPLSCHPVHKALNACLMRPSSREKRSNGQYVVQTSPWFALKYVCIQNLHVAVFWIMVSGERWHSAGKNPHFGCKTISFKYSLKKNFLEQP